MYQGYLTAGRKFSKDNSYFYFSESYCLGGGAIKIGEYYFVKIYIGTFNRLNDLFTKNMTLFDVPGFENIKEVNLPIITDFPINELMCQICLHFTYYHEVAHLHQDSNFLVNELNEDHTTNAFDIERHVLEYDADIFASLSICTHIYEYFDKWHTRKTIDDLEEITAILLSAILIRILLSPNIKIQFYTKDQSHPHWIIRMLKIIEVVITQMVNLVKNKYNMIIPKIKLTEKSLDYTIILNNELGLGIEIGNIIEIMRSNSEAIDKYSKDLWKEVFAYEKSAFNKWNS
ncbi:MAG: hypothetical protein RLZZ546_1192 [Bacteroidota bacterium]|jgi:hypothetical protein